MNYQKIYNDICNRGQIRILPKDIYVEKHHIIPKCMNGMNDKSNITVLTAKEHFLCHKILIKLYPENKKLLSAFILMCRRSKTTMNRYIPSGKVFEELKILNSIVHKNKVISNEMKLKLRLHNLGKKHSDESKMKMSESSKGFKHSEETKKKMRAPNTAEHNRKIKEARKNITISKESRIKQSISLKAKYDAGYINPRKGSKNSEESKHKRSETMKGFKHSEESKQRMKDNHPSKKEGWINPRNYESMSLESLQKQKDTWNKKIEEGWTSPLKNRKQSSEHIAKKNIKNGKYNGNNVKLYDDKNEYNSITEACNILNLTQRQIYKLIDSGILHRKNKKKQNHDTQNL